jgi:hypothetical protein
MEQSPSWEANRFAAIQEIPRILLNQNILSRIHIHFKKCPGISNTVSKYRDGI